MQIQFILGVCTRYTDYNKLNTKYLLSVLSLNRNFLEWILLTIFVFYNNNLTTEMVTVLPATSGDDVSDFGPESAVMLLQQRFSLYQRVLLI